MAFKVGDEVRFRYNFGCKGKVVEIDADDNEVTKVKFPNDHADWYDTEELRLADLVAEQALKERVQAKIDEAVAAFETAFEKLEELNAATNNQEGGTLYRLRELSDLVDVSKLDEVFDKRGWSSSSLYC